MALGGGVNFLMSEVPLYAFEGVASPTKALWPIVRALRVLFWTHNLSPAWRVPSRKSAAHLSQGPTRRKPTQQTLGTYGGPRGGMSFLVSKVPLYSEVKDMQRLRRSPCGPSCGHGRCCLGLVACPQHGGCCHGRVRPTLARVPHAASPHTRPPILSDLLCFTGVPR